MAAHGVGSLNRARTSCKVGFQGSWGVGGTRCIVLRQRGSFGCLFKSAVLANTYSQRPVRLNRHAATISNSVTLYQRVPVRRGSCSSWPSLSFWFLVFCVSSL